jgi:hypothetical protein
MTTKTPSKPEQSIVLADASDYPMLTMDPADLREAIQVNLMGETLQFKDLRRVKVPAGGAESWSIPSPDGGKPIPTNDFQGVIIHSEPVRVMWLKDVAAKNNGGPKGPDCSGKPDADGVFHGSKSRQWIAAAAKDPNLTPSDISGPAQTCADCPFAQFGSGKLGKGQKCQQKRVFYIATEDSLLPLVLIAPVMSLANAKKYLLGLSTSLVKVDGQKPRMMQYHEVITNFGLESDSNGDNDFARITFTRAAVLPAEQRQAFADYRRTIKPLISNLSTAAAVADAVTPVDTGNDFDIDAPGEMESRYEYIDADDEALPTDED